MVVAVFAVFGEVFCVGIVLVGEQCCCLVVDFHYECVDCCNGFLTKASLCCR